MTLLQRTRFGTWLKNVFGWRGPTPLDIPDTLSPVYDLARYDPLNDDDTAYWFASAGTAGPVAGQLSSVAVQFPASARAGVRASVDGFYLRSAVAAVTYNYGLCAIITDGASNPCSVRNNFLNQRAPLAISSATGFSALNFIQRSGAASVFTGFSLSGSLDSAAGLHTDIPSPFPVMLLTPGYSFAVECQAANTAINAHFWGRFLGDQT
jgi:hypothetical protein